MGAVARLLDADDDSGESDAVDGEGGTDRKNRLKVARRGEKNRKRQASQGPV